MFATTQRGPQPARAHIHVHDHAIDRHSSSRKFFKSLINFPVTTFSLCTPVTVKDFGGALKRHEMPSFSFHKPELLNVPGLEPWKLVAVATLLCPCHCLKVEKTAAQAVKIGFCVSASALFLSTVTYIFLPASIIGVAVGVSTVSLTAFGGIAIFELVRRKGVLPTKAQKVADNIHTAVIRSLCTLSLACHEKDHHLKNIFQRPHIYRFQSL